MSSAKPRRISLPSQPRPFVDARAVKHSASAYLRQRAVGDEENGPMESPLMVPIPTVLPQPDGYTTPLPFLSMAVLSITMLGEFLSANVSTPFILFMVRDFGEYTSEADIAFWTGVLVAVFFLTQFLTSLVWATIATRYGQRAVLFFSLLGTAITCAAFGFSKSLSQALVIRLLQGVFGGAVGVARGCVLNIGTDASNESRAYAILGFSWGLGGVTGAVIGGAFESPADKWPIFKNFTLLVNYPYLLPCAMAGSITLLGAIMSIFLARDGGPRTRLTESNEKAGEDDAASNSGDSTIDGSVVGTIRRQGQQVSKKVSGYFIPRAQPASPAADSPALSEHSALLPNGRTASRTRSYTPAGYGGLSGSYRTRLASAAGARHDSVVSHDRRRRPSHLEVPTPPAEVVHEDLNFAQRLVMANENTSHRIADFWVAAAINADNEDPFESDTEEDSLNGSSSEEETDNEAFQPDGRSPRTATRGIHGSFGRGGLGVPNMGSPRRPSSNGPRRGPSANRGVSIPGRRESTSYDSGGVFGTPSGHRYSTNMPAIFAHSGVRTPPAVAEAQRVEEAAQASSPFGNDTLAPILQRGVSMIAEESSSATPSVLVVEMEKPPSLSSQIPILIIVQYGVLALHNTTQDQVLLSYLVSDYDAGGLNLNAGHFAGLIAMMAVFEMFYQFVLYPNFGPPRGRFSHLAMFRIGTLLFVPTYLAVIFFRPLASADDGGNIVLMIALTICTAIRYCGNTFSYTAVSILLNCMTPPNAVPYANGVAQSIVSLARCAGPVLGGWLWSVSVEDNPQGYPWGFIVCAVVCAIANIHSFTIR